jgi:hypothetical protein
LFEPHVAGSSERQGGKLAFAVEVDSIEVLVGTHKAAHQKLPVFTMPPEQEHPWYFDLMTIDRDTADDTCFMTC